MNRDIHIELYKEKDRYCTYISEDGCSGYKIKADTLNDCAVQTADYIENTIKNTEYETD